MAFAILTEELSREGKAAFEAMLASEDGEPEVKRETVSESQVIEQNRQLAGFLGIALPGASE